MSTETEREEPAAEKKPYSPPLIIEYGQAVDLTGGGTGSRSESNMNQSMKYP